MFGYVKVNQPELKIKEFEKYHSYYCGLCRTLNNSFGLFGRITLNYDMVMLIMVLTDLYDEEEIVEERRCIIHPILKHKERVSNVTKYCSDMCLLLSYYKLLDDINDDNKFKSKVLALLLKGKIGKVKAKYPEKSTFIEKQLGILSTVENDGRDEIEKVATIFGNIMAEVFCYKNDEYKNDLYKMGLYLGKFIYLLDAYEDIELDIKSNLYNPFKDIYENPDFDKQVLDLLYLMISECTNAFERLPLVENIEILRNILYSGVWSRYNERKKKIDDGSISNTRDK